MLQTIIQIFIPFSLIFLAFMTGRYFESKHFQSIHEREKNWLAKPAVTFRSLTSLPEVARSRLVSGSVVVSVDHFKRLMMNIRLIFGGESNAYASLIERGRREAILRMKEKASTADMFVNCRVETATLFNGQGRSIGCVEIHAYGTAVTFKSTLVES